MPQSQPRLLLCAGLDAAKRRAFLVYDDDRSLAGESNAALSITNRALHHVSLQGIAPVTLSGLSFTPFLCSFAS